MKNLFYILFIATSIMLIACNGSGDINLHVNIDSMTIVTDSNKRIINKDTTINIHVHSITTIKQTKNKKISTTKTTITNKENDYIAE